MATTPPKVSDEQEKLLLERIAVFFPGQDSEIPPTIAYSKAGREITASVTVYRGAKSQGGVFRLRERPPPERGHYWYADDVPGN